MGGNPANFAKLRDYVGATTLQLFHATGKHSLVAWRAVQDGRADVELTTLDLIGRCDIAGAFGWRAAFSGPIGRLRTIDGFNDDPGDFAVTVIDRPWG